VANTVCAERELVLEKEKKGIFGLESKGNEGLGSLKQGWKFQNKNVKEAPENSSPKEKEKKKKRRGGEVRG